MTWGATSGRGPFGRIPDALRPVRKGGPGPEVFVSWQTVLRLSGEPVDQSTKYLGEGGAGKRYHSRVIALIQAGYEIPTDGNNPTIRAAPVGDTIEIRRIKGHRGQVAGIMVRASARFCAAYKIARKGLKYLLKQ